ncbi:class I SAM-dependent methyltransferase [Candidatus Woesearchaeota archaeon]|nr:class I SAM-dependent methyltransferase [Candidatus Woesearchaeota archaeon]MCF7900772.1 class I SAM-dependent methyltransferase [Candidatus Woesearchaeota archaeon]MCF8012937.1 class I SAM-dependent methyltransferase [Candidatus Woesearchaeota archaeon]
MNRIYVINKLLKLFSWKNTDYLEIGIRRGETLARIEATYKIGVDPNPQINKIDGKYKLDYNNTKILKLTSDEFFKNNKNYFDVIFIDGLHLYEQAMKDILNALNFLKKGGFIIVHDCNPLTKKAASRKQTEGVWNGDVWKCIYDISKNYEKQLDYFVLNSDFGLGIITKKDNSKFIPSFNKEIIKLDYNYLNKNKSFLKLKNKYYFKTYVSKNYLNIKKYYTTGIVAVYDYEPMDCILYKESLSSAFNACDKLIIVYGGNLRKDNKSPVLDYLKKTKNRFLILYYNWPKEYNWTQFAKSYEYGKSHIDSKWGFFFTCDEIFSPKFKLIKWFIKYIPNHIWYINIIRLFLTSKKTGSKYNSKRIYFRNKDEINFGIISADEPVNSNYRDFGRIINITKWRKKHKYIHINEKMNHFNIIKNARKGILLKGFRDTKKNRTLNLPVYYINTHLLFCKKELAVAAKIRSNKGYLNLPKRYCLNKISREDAAIIIKNQIEREKCNKQTKISCWEKKLLKKYELIKL